VVAALEGGDAVDVLGELAASFVAGLALVEGAGTSPRVSGARARPGA
jgi:hypothetical protein